MLTDNLGLQVTNSCLKLNKTDKRLLLAQESNKITLRRGGVRVGGWWHPQKGKRIIYSQGGKGEVSEVLRFTSSTLNLWS